MTEAATEVATECVYSYNPLFLHKRHALITGGSSGIGREIAALLTLNGANVTIIGTKLEKLNETIAYVHQRHQSYLEQTLSVFSADVDVKSTLGTIAFLQRDVRDDTSRIVLDAEEVMGSSVDILVNNAGITRDMLMLKMSAEQFDDVIAVNLKAPFQLMQAFVKQNIKTPLHHGAIINIASVVGFTGNIGQANYTAAKAGLIGMTKTFAKECARYHITVNAVAPGFIRTEMTEHIPEKLQQGLLENIPLKTMGSVEDIAHAVLYLSSLNARYITGSTIHVNGGMFMA